MTFDLIPALLAGCAAIVKPSEITPRFMKPWRPLVSSHCPHSRQSLYESDDGRNLWPGDARDAVCLPG